MFDLDVTWMFDLVSDVAIKEELQDMKIKSFCASVSQGTFESCVTLLKCFSESQFPLLKDVYHGRQ